MSGRKHKTRMHPPPAASVPLPQHRQPHSSLTKPFFFSFFCARDVQEGKSEKIKIASLTKSYLLKIEARVKAMQKKTLKNLSKITCSKSAPKRFTPTMKRFRKSTSELSHSALKSCRMPDSPPTYVCSNFLLI